MAAEGLAALDRDTLFRKLRAKPENKVCCFQHLPQLMQLVLPSEGSVSGSPLWQIIHQHRQLCFEPAVRPGSRCSICPAAIRRCNKAGDGL